MRYMWLGGLMLGLLPLTASNASAGHVGFGVNIGLPYVGVGFGGYRHHSFFRAGYGYGYYPCYRGYCAPYVRYGYCAPYYYPPAVVYTSPTVVYTTPPQYYVPAPVYTSPAPQGQYAPVPQPAPQYQQQYQPQYQQRYQPQYQQSAPPVNYSR